MSLLSGMTNMLQNDAVMEMANDDYMFELELALEAEEFIDGIVDGKPFAENDEIERLMDEDEIEDEINDQLDDLDNPMYHCAAESYFTVDDFEFDDCDPAYESYDDLDEYAMEGAQIDSFKKYFSDDAKRARKLYRQGKKMLKTNPTACIQAMDECIEIAEKIKTDVSKVKDQGTFMKIISYLNPLLLLIKDSELDSVTPGLMYDGNGLGTTLSFNYKTHDDEMSKNAPDAMAKSVQRAMNLFIIRCNNMKEKANYKMKNANESYDDFLIDDEFDDYAGEAAALKGDAFLRSLALDTDDPIKTHHGSIGYEEGTANYAGNYSNGFLDDDDPIETDYGSIGQQDSAANFYDNYSAESDDNNDPIKTRYGSYGQRSASANPTVESAIFFGELLGEEAVMEGLLDKATDKVVNRIIDKHDAFYEKIGADNHMENKIDYELSEAYTNNGDMKKF